MAVSTEIAGQFSRLETVNGRKNMGLRTETLFIKKR
jgi:hypothetical protein